MKIGPILEGSRVKETARILLAIKSLCLNLVKDEAETNKLQLDNHSIHGRVILGFRGDSIHFQTTIPNRAEKADSPKTIDFIQCPEVKHQISEWCARRELNPQPSASEADALSN
jgi:hypothetical protein